MLNRIHFQSDLHGAQWWVLKWKKEEEEEGLEKKGAVQHGFIFFSVHCSSFAENSILP